MKIRRSYFMKIKILICLIIFNIFCLHANNDLKKPKIAIISLYNEGYKHIGQYSDENKKKYAEKHGYDVFIYHKLLDENRPAPWSKILAIQRHLSDYDWVFWSDADSLIMNTNTRLESIIDDKFDLIIAKECYLGYLNTGSFLIKNTKWSQDLLKRIYSQEQFTNSYGLWEQQALDHLLKIDQNLLPHLKIVHQRVLNSNFDFTPALDCWYQEGDFVVHFFGDCDKVNLMRIWSQKVVY